VARKIVAGVDESDTALVAARKAAALARNLPDTELHVISAYGPAAERTVQAGTQKVHLHPMEYAQTVAENVASSLLADFPDLAIVAGAVEGKPARALTDYSEEIGAVLIVVGNKRTQGAARVLGSVAAGVAQKSHCDVYIAHTH